MRGCAVQHRAVKRWGCTVMYVVGCTGLHMVVQGYMGLSMVIWLCWWLYTPYNSPSLPLFKKLKILNINQINDLHISLFMFDIHNNDLLRSLLFNELFKANRNVHDHNTRSANKLHKRYNRTNYGQLSLSSKGIDKWNETPEKIKKAISSRNIFKREIQKHLIQQ